MRRMFAGMPMETAGGGKPTRTKSGEWMIRTTLDLPYSMLASLEATAGSEDIGNLIRIALAAAGHGNREDALGVRSDHYATDDERREAVGYAARERGGPAGANTVPTGTGQPRYEAVLKPLEWEQRMRVDYRDDVVRIIAVLAADGIAISEDVAFMAWHRFSEEDRCAGWYGPGTDEEIRRNLMPHLTLRPVAQQDR